MLGRRHCERRLHRQLVVGPILLNPRHGGADDPIMRPSSTSFRDERGFTLVEVMVAASILVVGVLGVLTMLDAANGATARTKAREGGVNLAREAIEAARAVPYPELIPAQVGAELQAQPGLGDVDPAPGWQVRRRGLTYTLTVNVCSVDDGTLATDGFGDHTGGFYCADSTTQGTADTNPDDYKRVMLDISWRDGARTPTARQEGVINNPGSAFAPAVKTLAPSPSTVGTVITNSSLSSIAFAATTSSRAEEVKWSVDNLQAGVATAGNAAKTMWSFSWDISGLVDGTYLVSAEAFDQYGESGTNRVLTMQLNRFQPAAPAGFAGGRNPLHDSGGNRFVEFEWSPSPERDVVGYRVYRMIGAAPSASDEAVCTTSVEDDALPTTCRHTSAPDPALGPRYYLVARAPARTGTGLEESPRPGVAGTLVVGEATPPAPPATVTGERNADGTTLTWTASSDPDIRYYRVYRDGAAFGQRIDRTGSSEELTASDPQATAAGHRYWVTAVDDKLAESAYAPPGGIAP